MYGIFSRCDQCIHNKHATELSKDTQQSLRWISWQQLVGKVSTQHYHIAVQDQIHFAN